MMAGNGCLHGVAHDLAKVDFGFFASCFLVAGASGAKHLLDGLGEAVGVAQHQAIEILALRFWKVAAQKSFQMQTDGGNRRLQFMRDVVDKAVMLLVAPNFANQKNRVHNQPAKDHCEDNQAKKTLKAFSPT